MKSIFSLVLTSALFLAASCGTLKYNRLYSYDDEFSGKSKKYTRVRIRPVERRTEIGYVLVMLILVYGCGLRRSEVLELLPADIDHDRKLIRIRQSKGFRDRLVQLSARLI